jgi:hypothetical protein
MRKGFLIRGTLRPNLGSMTGVPRNMSASALSKSKPIPTKNRIPGSITVKRVPGTR